MPNVARSTRTLEIGVKRWLIVLVAFAGPVQASASGGLAEMAWNHGSKDCTENRDPALEVYRFDANTYILRQNKCVNFEAPFIYVLFGQQKAFVLDTGATADPNQFPLYETVRSLVAQRNQPKLWNSCCALPQPRRPSRSGPAISGQAWRNAGRAKRTGRARVLRVLGLAAWRGNDRSGWPRA